MDDVGLKTPPFSEIPNMKIFRVVVLLVVRPGCMAGGVITLLAFASPSPHGWTWTRGLATQSGGVAG